VFLATVEKAKKEDGMEALIGDGLVAAGVTTAYFMVMTRFIGSSE
jgi:hypothetical protein